MAKSKKVLGKSSSARPYSDRICNVVASRNTETDWAPSDAIAAGAVDAQLAAPPENATTGYRWAIDRLDRDVVEEAGSEAHPSGGAIGSAGNVTFDFRAKKAGGSEIALKYWRHFEGDASIVKRFRFRLNATP